ncbi:MAG: ferrous iron transporter B, partial [Bacteroidota bacterium]
DFADEVLKEVMYPADDIQKNISSRIDTILTHRIWGYLVFFAVLILIFQSIFSWASYPSDAIDAWVEGIKSSLDDRLSAGWGKDLLIDGIITGFGGIVVFIPQIAILFFFVAIMEESGYMARVVFLMDRIMRPFGFSGKSIIPLMGGMACAIPSIMMTRNIPNKYERLITIMVTPLMSCSARIPVYTLLIAMFIPAHRILGLDQRGLFMTGLYVLGFVMALAVAWMFKKILGYKSDGVFIMEMPGYQSPQWKNVGLTVYQRVKDFLLGAGKIILAISIVLWFLVSYGPSNKMEAIDQAYTEKLSQVSPDSEEGTVLERSWKNSRLESSYAAILGKFIEPVIRPLGYDWKIGISLISSFAAREIFVSTMSIIYNQEDPGEADDSTGELNARQSLIERLQAETDPKTGRKIYTTATVASLLIFYVFAMQCMSTLAVTKREAGWTWAFIMLIYLTLLAYGAAWITYLCFNL